MTQAKARTNRTRKPKAEAEPQAEPKAAGAPGLDDLSGALKGRLDVSRRPAEGSYFRFADGRVKAQADTSLIKGASDPARMYHRFQISTPTPDQLGDVMVPRGCKLGRFSKNPVVYFDHGYVMPESAVLPVGKSADPDSNELDLAVTDAGLEAGVYYHGQTVLSAQVYELVDLGYINGASIGFDPVKGEKIKRDRPEEDAPKNQIDFEPWFPIKFTEWELLEWSIVGIPCNAECVRKMASAGFKAAGQPLVDEFRRKLYAEYDDVLTAKASSATVPPEIEKVVGTDPDVDPNADPETPSPDEEPEFTPTEIINLDEWREKLLANPGKALSDLFELCEVESFRPHECRSVLNVSNDGGLHGFAIAYKMSDLIAPPSQPGEPRPHDEPDGDEPQPSGTKSQLPAGCKALLRLCKGVSAAAEGARKANEVVEHPDVGPYVLSACEGLDGVCKDVSAFGHAHYPDHFDAPDAAEQADKALKEAERKAAEEKASAEKAEAERLRLEKEAAAERERKAARDAELAERMENLTRLFEQVTGREI